MKKLVLVLVVGLAMMSCDSRSAQAHRKAQAEQAKMNIEANSKAHAMEVLTEIGTVISSGTTLNYNVNRAGLSATELHALAVMADSYEVVFINEDIIQ